LVPDFRKIFPVMLIPASAFLFQVKLIPPLNNFSLDGDDNSVRLFGNHAGFLAHDMNLDMRKNFEVTRFIYPAITSYRASLYLESG
jgi:hypothetical protein